LAICTKNLEAQLRESQCEARQQPKKLQEKMEKVVLEGNNIREILYKCTPKGTRIFQEVSDWMVIIARRNQTLEDVGTEIQSLNEEVVITMDPLE